MSRFIRFGRDYINCRNILRWEITKTTSKKLPKWQATAYLHEYRYEGMGSFLYYSNKGNNVNYYWTFETEDEAHKFIQRNVTLSK